MSFVSGEIIINKIGEFSGVKYTDYSFGRILRVDDDGELRVEWFNNFVHNNGPGCVYIMSSDVYKLDNTARLKLHNTQNAEIEVIFALNSIIVRNPPQRRDIFGGTPKVYSPEELGDIKIISVNGNVAPSNISNSSKFVLENLEMVKAIINSSFDNEKKLMLIQGLVMDLEFQVNG